MRIFKTRLFAKWAQKERLTDKALAQAVEEMERGLVDANLGGNVYKKRIPVGGRGKSGGTRSILAYKASDKAFFIFGYAKNVKANISDEDLKLAKDLAKELLNYTTEVLDDLVKKGKLYEVLICWEKH